MKRLAGLILLLLLLLPLACQREAESDTAGADSPVTFEVPPMSTPPTPTLDEEASNGGFSLGGTGEPTATPDALAPVAPVTPVAPADNAFSGPRFSGLRFATSGSGIPQSTFPASTEEIYAIWDYDGMSATDTMERVWYHEGVEYVDVSEPWDFSKYGSVGAVRDVFLYDYIDGIDPGTWRVEIFLNGEQKLIQQFTVTP